MEQKRITEPTKTPATDRELRAKTQELNVSEFMKAFIPRMIVFEKEAKKMMEFMKINPSATEKEVEEKLLEIVEEVRKELGLPIRVRRDLIG